MEISQREAEVLAAIGAHQSNAQIANRMHISVRTVESHVSSLLRKFGVTDRRTLAERAGSLPVAPEVRPGRFYGLPAPGTSFIGRVRERESVLAALANARVVTLLGPGGMGKTRLAIEVSRAVSGDYPSGGAFVDLVPARSVSAATGEALGVAEVPGQPIERVVLDRLRRGRSLLVLDNCEHLIDEVGELVGRVLAECPLAVILATSRERLAVPGERIVDVPPLPEATELFRTRAGARFAAPPEVVSRICACVDGMPLAIELAAARAGSLGADGLLAALEDRLRLLTGGRGVRERHRSLRAVLGWSHDLLDEAERAMLRRVSVFAGSFDLDAAAAVCPGTGRTEVADLIGRLVDKSLIVHSGRWRLLDTVRAFGRDLLSPAERDEVRGLHLCWAAGAALEAPFDEVADDLRAALAATPPVPDATAHKLARSLALRSVERGQFRAAHDHYRAAAHRAGSATDECRDLRAAADTAIVVADGPGAFGLLLAEAERAPDGDGRAAALAYAAIAAVRYRADVADERCAALIAEASATGVDGGTTALVAGARAWHARATAAPDALAAARAAVTTAENAGSPVLVAGALDILAAALADAGHLREAHEATAGRLSMVDNWSAADPAVAAELVDAFHMGAKTALGAGDLPAAREVLARGKVANPVHEHPYITAPMLIRVLALGGEFDAALARAEEMWDQWRRDGSPAMGWMSTAMALAAMVHGLRADARFDPWRARALEMAGCSDPAQSPVLARCLAFVDVRVSIHLGHTHRAARLVERTETSVGEPWWTCYAVAAAAELAVVAGLPDAAERLASAGPFAEENDWAAACLARARGRLTGDAGTLADAATRWERLGARFERACTLVLIPDRAAEGRAELDALRCRDPED